MDAAGGGVEHDEVEFLNVRETAQRLGVHENTVRNWVRAGILQSARIPGSQFHRFDARDVERLAQQRGATVRHRNWVIVPKKGA